MEKYQVRFKKEKNYGLGMIITIACSFFFLQKSKWKGAE